MAVLTTTRLGLPYPDGNDRLRDGDNRIGDLSAKLDDLNAVGIPFALAAGDADIVASGSAPVPSIAVTFPAGRFAHPPIVFGQCIGSARYVNVVVGASTAGMSLLGVENSHTAATNVPADTYTVHWIAVQMLPGASPG